MSAANDYGVPQYASGISSEMLSKIPSIEQQFKNHMDLMQRDQSNMDHALEFARWLTGHIHTDAELHRFYERFLTDRNR